MLQTGTVDKESNATDEEIGAAVTVAALVPKPAASTAVLRNLCIPFVTQYIIIIYLSQLNSQ